MAAVVAVLVVLVFVVLEEGFIANPTVLNVRCTQYPLYH